MAILKINSRPKQKVSSRKKYSEKGVSKWGRDNMDWADGQIFQTNSFTRKSFQRKYTNYKLWQGDLSMSDMKALLGPHTMDFRFEPDDMQHYPIVTPLINVLLGEESNRTTDYQVIITNPDAISDMEERKAQEVKRTLNSMLQNNYPDEQELSNALDKKAEFFKYSYQDMLEVRANWLFNHFMQELGVKAKLNAGFFNTLLVGEEIYQCDVVSGNPTFETLNPLKTHVLLNGYSNLYEDADIIIYQDHMSPGDIIDTYFDYLTPSDIDTIESMTIGDQTDSMNNYDPTAGFVFTGEDGELSDGEFDSLESALGVSRLSGFYANDPVDAFGNIRILKVYWKSYKLLQKVGMIDPETGEYYEDLMPESYILNEELGEKLIKKIWVNHAYEGIKVGEDIYPYVRPRKIQYNRVSNPSKCHFGITGVVSSYNEFRAVSFMDRLKPYQYMYDIVMARVNDAIAKDIGSAYELDIAKLPSGMDEIDWYYFLIKNKIALADSFKEGNKGAATGKLAGQMNTVGKPINFSQASFIEYNLKLLDFLKAEMAYISGITPQRMGSMKASETQGGIERSVLQSSYNTEPYFSFHYIAVQRALQTFLDTIIFAMRGNTKKFRSIGDDLTSILFEINGDDLASLDLGLLVDINNSSTDVKQKLDNLAHAAMQTQTASLAGLVKIYEATSLASVKRILEAEEEKAHKRAQEANNNQMQAEMKAKAEEAALRTRELDIEEDSNKRDNDTKVEVEMMKMIEKRNEINSTDYTSMDNDELTMKRDKLNADIDKIVNDYTLAKKSHRETVRHNKATENIAKNKPNTK